jgi:hypothetical protein
VRISECVSCVPRVFIHASVVCVACGIEILDVLDIRFEWLRLYESLLTCVAHMDLVGDPIQDTCHARASEILITKIHKIFYLRIRRIFM